MAQPTTAFSKGYDLRIEKGLLLGKEPQSESKATLGLVIDRLRDSYPNANIAMPPSLANVPVGDLKLRTGSLWDELEAVRVATSGKFEWKGPGFPVFFAGQDTPGIVPFQGVDPATGLPAKNPDFPNAGLFVLREARARPESERVVEAFNIGSYLEWLAENRQPGAGSLNALPLEERKKIRAEARDEGIREIQKIILETISQLEVGSESGIRPEFQFHSGANLLILIGTREMIDVAHKVIAALPGQSIGSSSAFNPAAPNQPLMENRYGLPPGPTKSIPNRTLRQPPGGTVPQAPGLTPGQVPPSASPPEPH